MNKLLKTIYLTILFAFSINAQTQGNKSFESNTAATNLAKISEIIPIKKGTTLKRIESAKQILKTEEDSSTKQAQSYVFPVKKKRFNNYLNRTFGTGLIGVGASSVVQQIAETPPEWEQNGKGFLRRVGSNFGTQVISETVAYGLEESLGLDGKFYKSEQKDLGSRVKNAVLSSFTARTRSGKRVFNPSRITGRYTGEIIATETWYPERYSYKDGLRRGTRGIGFNVGLNFLREFVFPK